MSCLDIVIAYGLGVIAQPVDNLGSGIGQRGLDEVGVVACRLALKNVAILQQYEIVAILLAQLLDIRAYPGQGTLHGSVLDVVVREETSVDVAGLDDSQIYNFLFGHCG